MAAAEVTTVDVGARRVARRVVVEAPPGVVFDLVADPYRHPELDGSGTVRDVHVDGPARLSRGARFTVGMRQMGVPYSITSTVTEYEEDRVVEWRHPAGHRWRWELREVSPGRTQVTEVFDYSTVGTARVLELLGIPGRNARGITATLQALVARFG